VHDVHIFRQLFNKLDKQKSIVKIIDEGTLFFDFEQNIFKSPIFLIYPLIKIKFLDELNF